MEALEQGSFQQHNFFRMQCLWEHDVVTVQRTTILKPTRYASKSQFSHLTPGQAFFLSVPQFLFTENKSDNN